MRVSYRMGRRRLRLIVTALLLCLRNALCQNENDFYYTPVERNFAQIQPALYPSNRPSSYYDNGDTFRALPSKGNTAQQPLYNEGHVRFPSPNYNQNPSPFQLPTGRSQSGNQYYQNQPEYIAPQRQRFRPSLPHNYQLVHPASTNRPDVSQIHSYQHDPSKPEAFLGQVTLNNPDIEYLINNRFKDLQFDNNSLRSTNINNHPIPNDGDYENNNQDLLEHLRVTTYNPTKTHNVHRIVKPNAGRLSHLESTSVNERSKGRNPARISFGTNIDKQSKPHLSPSYRDSPTEYKSMLNIESLLEDNIKDLTSFQELMKTNNGSNDVQVIKQKNSDEVKFDSNPSASSMNADNIHQYSPPEETNVSHDENLNSDSKETQVNNKVQEDSASLKEGNTQSSETDEAEYEYYDDFETTPEPRTTQKSSPLDHPDDYDDYENQEESEQFENKPNNNPAEPFDVLVMKPNNTKVSDDNFKHFKDTTAIDQIDNISQQNLTETNFETSNKSDPEIISIETSSSHEDLSSSIESILTSSEQTFLNENPSILGQEVVSVVTTKSVVNGTISVPDVIFNLSTPKSGVKPESVEEKENLESIPVTTENWVVVASVQTSRSVSGARFLPFPAVEQEEKKQVLTDEKLDENDDSVTKNPADARDPLIPETTSMSTENINDKLDSIQSELSSGVLSGSLNKNIEVIKETTTNAIVTTTTLAPTTTPETLNVFTLKSTIITPTTERSAPEPPPVFIKKFAPKSSTTSTTAKPKKKFVTVMDELPPGFLPPGYRPRSSYKDKKSTSTTTTTTTTTTTSTTPLPSAQTSGEDYNATQARSIGMGNKNKVILLDGKSPNVPKDDKNNKPIDTIFKQFQPEDISKFLPPGYKAPAETKNEKIPDILDKAQKIDLADLLPKGYVLNETTTEKVKLPIKIEPVDVSAFLPPNFKVNESDKTPDIIKTFKPADISNLLPPGFNVNETEETVSPTKAPNGGFKLVFPSRPNSKPARKSTTPKSVIQSGPIPATPKIQKGWPTRASTEFTGWPSPSTTPFSIEKLLEAQRNATATSPMTDITTETFTRRTTTTTSTTTMPPPSTTPGVCTKECDIAATIKIVSGVKWVPELLNRHTDEWKKLADEVKDELNSVYSKSDSLKKWFKDIRVEGFTQGSVLVDYYIELSNIAENIDTLELKKLFHEALSPAQRGAAVESSAQKESGFDSDAMLGDQPEEDRSKEQPVNVSVDKLEIGRFVMDPAYTEFIVLPKREEPMYVAPDEEESFLPQWGIAVIVIAMASLLFVVIFGVTVLVNRQKSAKAKQPIPLSDDMFRELDKNHMGGFDDLHPVKDRELPYHSGKRMSSAFIEQLAYQNPGDSWRSEWTPQLQKHMQHYTPDSGRGSQIYGAPGNIYGYSGSQIYGQTGGSQVYGYTGEYPSRSHYPRRRPDYDDDF